MAVELRYFVGFDIGQACDFSALSILERPRVTPATPKNEQRPFYACRHLQRWPLGVAYPVIVKSVVQVLLQPVLNGCVLVVDQTGVGRAVVDMLDEEIRKQKAQCKRVAISITGGTAITMGSNDAMHVPKVELIARLQALFQMKRLKIAKQLPEAKTLARELEAFRVKITASANETMAPEKAGQHDDLLLSVALAAYIGEATLPGPKTPRPGGQQVNRIILR